MASRRLLLISPFFFLLLLALSNVPRVEAQECVEFLSESDCWGWRCSLACNMIYHSFKGDCVPNKQGSQMCKCTYYCGDIRLKLAEHASVDSDSLLAKPSPPTS